MMPTSRKNVDKILQIPSHITAKHRSMFGASVVDHAFVSTHTEVAAAAREARDVERSFWPLPGDARLLERCESAVTRVRVLVEGGASTLQVGLAANEAAEVILAALRQNPDGAVLFTNAMERLAENLVERLDTQFCAPSVLIPLALLWAKDGELPAAQRLLDCTMGVLDSLIRSGDSHISQTQHVALVHCAMSGLAEASRKPGARLTALRQAWDSADNTDDAELQWFVAIRYLRVLQSQRHPHDVIVTADYIVKQKELEAGLITDWLLLNWPCN